LCLFFFSSSSDKALAAVNPMLSMETQSFLYGFVLALGACLVYIAFLAKPATRKQFFKRLREVLHMKPTPEDQAGGSSGSGAPVSQALGSSQGVYQMDGHRVVTLGANNARDAALAQSSMLMTAHSDKTDSGYILPELRNAPPSIMNQLRH
jgi:hypothetical protein